MSYIRHPDLFITTTTNRNWPEIKNSSLPGQDPQDRPDIVACVFSSKAARNAQIEWQKHGLPHCHLLLWLLAENRITPDKIDSHLCRNP